MNHFRSLVVFVSQFSHRLHVLVVMLCVGTLSNLSFANTTNNGAYDSELAAVRAATDLYNPISLREDREFMGAIVRQGSHYSYTVLPGKLGGDSVSLTFSGEDWQNVVALWHTHGDASPLRQFFSHFDTKLVQQTGKRFYLADYTGVLKVFSPEHRTLSSFAASRLGLPPGRGFATGEPVTDRNKQPILVQTSDAELKAYC